MIAALVLRGHGAAHAAAMAELDHAQITLALLRDGFHPESVGGRVRLDRYGHPQLDYPLTPYLFDGMRRAYLTMAELQFAAGAKSVLPIHDDAAPYRSWAEARQAIAALPMQALRAKVVSAHVMGGCALSPEARNGVANLQGRHHQLDKLSIIDGSIFPTSIGANPQLSIYAFAARLAEGLASELKGG
jgi:choline dehydrogenase-like flavoprotein